MHVDWWAIFKIKKPNFEEKEIVEEDWNAKAMTTLPRLGKLEGMWFEFDSFKNTMLVLWCFNYD